MKLEHISVKKTLHFLGFKGMPLETEWIKRLQALEKRVCEEIEPRVVMRRFALTADGSLQGTNFFLQGADVCALLTGCKEAVLLAATIGTQSERMLLREQALGASKALLLDAMLSAAIETVCDQAQAELQEKLAQEALYVTDRFSPGYGDMPLEQSREICEVLSAEKAIGLTVSKNGIMIPRKSVTAIMGVSPSPTVRRPSGCAQCAARATCPLARREE